MPNVNATFQRNHAFLEACVKKAVNVETDVLRIKPVDAAASASANGTTWNGLGYTGGSLDAVIKTLTNPTVVNTAGVVTVDADNLDYTATGGAAALRYFVLYYEVAFGGHPILPFGLISFDALTNLVDGQPFTIRTNSDVFLTLGS